MVQASSINNKKTIRVNAVAKNARNAVEASNSTAKYWAEIAQTAATSAGTSETNAEKIYNDIAGAKDGVLAEIDEAKDGVLAKIDEAKEAAIEEIENKGNIGDVPTKVSELENDVGYLSDQDTIKVKSITQEDYNDLTEKDSNTLYVILSSLLVWGTSLWGTGNWELGDGELSGD